MIYAAIALFALAAVLGLTILITWMKSKDASKAVIYSHGAVAATALVLLIVYSVQNSEHFPLISLILFPAGALGGFYMFFTYREGKKRPVAIAVLHALIGVTAFSALLIFTFG